MPERTDGAVQAEGLRDGFEAEEDALTSMAEWVLSSARSSMKPSRAIESVGLVTRR